MTGRLLNGRLLAAVAVACAALLGSAGRAEATDDYTLPFYDPAVALSYGMDRDARACYQRDWANTLWADCALHYGRVYDGHTGMDYPMGLLSPVAAARDGTVVDLFEGYGTQQFGTYGNFVLLSHADGRRTLSYHLAQGGVRVAVGQAIRAGQWLADSGCSGQCYGAHLHFEMQRLGGGRWLPMDPIYAQLFTTSPARVPFLASYYRESNAKAEVIRQYTTITHWVEFVNRGGRTWRNAAGVGQLMLGTWNPASRTSGFVATDWYSSWVPTPLDQPAVGPDGIGRFTFGLRAGVPVGSYAEAFNLFANSLRWFDWNRLGQFYVPISVITNQLE